MSRVVQAGATSLPGAFARCRPFSGWLGQGLGLAWSVFGCRTPASAAGAGRGRARASAGKEAIASGSSRTKRRGTKRRGRGRPSVEFPRAAEIRIPERFNAAAFFLDRHLASDAGERLAFRCQGRGVTYREVGDGAARAAGALRASGVEI